MYYASPNPLARQWNPTGLLWIVSRLVMLFDSVLIDLRILDHGEGFQSLTAQSSQFGRRQSHPYIMLVWQQ